MTTHITVALNTTTPTLVSPFGVHSGVDITIQNLDTSYNVHIGAEGVTSENFGFRLSPEQAISFELPGHDALYAIADGESSAGSTKVAVIMTGLEDR
jgi:hypothetical protein